MAKLNKGISVLILGAGISGLLHSLAAKLKGAGRVIVTDINEYRLKAALSLGADAAINAKEDLPAALRHANDGRLADLVIVSTGATSAFMQALVSVDRAGTILCFAATDPGVTLPVPVNEFWRQSITITHSYGASPDDLKEAIVFMQSTKIPVAKLITHRLGLKDAGLGFQLAASGKECIKVIIEPDKI
jgi:L-iditol 2-dehydrogenase